MKPKTIITLTFIGVSFLVLCTLFGLRSCSVQKTTYTEEVDVYEQSDSQCDEIIDIVNSITSMDNPELDDPTFMNYFSSLNNILEGSNTLGSKGKATFSLLKSCFDNYQTALQNDDEKALKQAYRKFWTKWPGFVNIVRNRCT